MKLIKILFFGLFLFSGTVSAQYGYGGVRNNGIPNNQQTPKEPTAKEIEEMRAERTEKYMQVLNAELKLDELQYIAIKNEILKTSKSIDIVMKSDYSDEEKANQVKAIQESTDKTIASYLNAAQKIQYEKLKSDKKTKKEDKKKKKGQESEPANEAN
ncbi:hypothetical protein [Flavobacterium sp.]|uniref:hypothetical protein n=1 Tax=Flavobacterium sp. TaxID=239 RepID=UPI002FDD430B